MKIKKFTEKNNILRLKYLIMFGSILLALASVVTVALSVLADAYDTSSGNVSEQAALLLSDEDASDEGDGAELMGTTEEIIDYREEFNGKITKEDWTGNDWEIMWDEQYRTSEENSYGWDYWWRTYYLAWGVKQVEDLGYVESFTVPTTEITINVGDSYTLKPQLSEVAPADYIVNSNTLLRCKRWDGNGKYVVYNNANAAIATISYKNDKNKWTNVNDISNSIEGYDCSTQVAAGKSVKVTGVSRGTTWFMVCSGGFTKEYKSIAYKIKVTVVDPCVTSLKVANQDVTIRKGKTVYDSYCVNVQDSASTNVTVTVTSGKDKITAKLDKDKCHIAITAKKTGTAKIKVTTKGKGANGKRKTKYITVKVVKNKSCGKGKHTWVKWNTLVHHDAKTKTNSLGYIMSSGGASCNACGYHGSLTQPINGIFIQAVHAAVHGGADFTTYHYSEPVKYVVETKGQYDTKKVKNKRCSKCGATKK